MNPDEKSHRLLLRARHLGSICCRYVSLSGDRDCSHLAKLTPCGLWILADTLENSYSIYTGRHPYRDFLCAPAADVPDQAAIIKLTGRVFWHHVAYCATVGGLSTVLTCASCKRFCAAQ